MEMNELRAGWDVLNERLAQNEILNKRIIKEMIMGRILTAQQRLMWKIIGGYAIYMACFILTLFSHALFGTPLLIVYMVSGFLLFSTLCGLPTFLRFYGFDMEKPLKDSLQRILFYQKSMRLLYPMIVGLSFIMLSFLFCYFWDFGYNRMTFIYVSASLIALVGSAIEYRWDFSKLDAMKKGLEELKEFEKE